MEDKLAIITMGYPNSGKTTTWISLFGRTVKTGKELRRLYLEDKKYIDVFLVSGSPEERGKYVGDLITQDEPTIVLCSMQYRSDSTQTIEYFLEHGYSLFVQWLNPGYRDSIEEKRFDSLGLTSYLLSKDATISIRDGKATPDIRVREIRDYLHGWSNSRNLIKTD